MKTEQLDKGLNLYRRIELLKEKLAEIRAQLESEKPLFVKIAINPDSYHGNGRFLVTQGEDGKAKDCMAAQPEELDKLTRNYLLQCAALYEGEIYTLEIQFKKL